MRGDMEGLDRRPVLWCRHCGEPVRRAGAGNGPPGKVVHAGTGAELCTDGEHAAAPIDVNPEMSVIASRVAKDYPAYEVAEVFGVMFRATMRGVLTPVPVEASTEEELRRGIERQIRMRELAARDEEHRGMVP